MHYVLLFFEELRVFCFTVSSAFAKIAIFPERLFFVGQYLTNLHVWYFLLENGFITCKMVKL